MLNLKKHLESRHLDLNLYPDCVTCEETQTFTMFLWNLSGKLVGYQTYRPEAPKNDYTVKPSEKKYFTFLSKSGTGTPELTAWGLHLLNPKKRKLFVCEGFADAVRLHNLGLNALALLSCDPKPLKSWLWSLGYEVVPVCEGDKAGLKMAKLSTHSKAVYLEEGKDLGDLTESELLSQFSEYL
jgi:hypothetical protein